MNAKAHAIMDFLSHNLIGIGGLFFTAILHLIARYFFSKTINKELVVKIVDNKEVAKNVHVNVVLENAQLQAGVSVDILVIAGPLLDKIADLIPGHFEDGIIAEAKLKLAELAAAPKA